MENITVIKRHTSVTANERHTIVTLSDGSTIRVSSMDPESYHERMVDLEISEAIALKTAHFKNIEREIENKRNLPNE